MASAMYPDDTKSSPPYGFHNEMNRGVPYDNQVPPPAYPSSFVGSPPPQSSSSTPVYTQPPVFNPVIGVPFLGHNPTPIQCPTCHQQVVTIVQYENGTGTWLISLVICFFGGIFGCFLIPFCVPACQDAIHICPSCKNLIGRRNVF